MMPFQQNYLHLQKQNLDIFTKYGFFYLFTFICKPKRMFVSLKECLCGINFEFLNVHNDFQEIYKKLFINTNVKD